MKKKNYQSCLKTYQFCLKFKKKVPELLEFGHFLVSLSRCKSSKTNYTYTDYYETT
jgi:hypothetical protein